MAKNIRHDGWYIHVWRTHTSANVQPYTPHIYNTHTQFTTHTHNLQHTYTIYNTHTQLTTQTLPSLPTPSPSFPFTTRVQTLRHTLIPPLLTMHHLQHPCSPPPTTPAPNTHTQARTHTHHSFLSFNVCPRVSATFHSLSVSVHRNSSYPWQVQQL